MTYIPVIHKLIKKENPKRYEWLALMTGKRLFCDKIVESQGSEPLPDQVVTEMQPQAADK